MSESVCTLPRVTVDALCLRPGSDSLEAVTLTREAGGTHLASLYAALGVRLVDVIRLTDDIDCWADDEGRMNAAEPNLLGTSLLRAFGWHLAHDDAVRGALLFAAHDGTGGMASLSDRQRDIIMDAFVQAQRM